MLPHMVGEFVILLFLKLPVVERFRLFRQFTGKRFEQEVDKFRIIENAVNVSPRSTIYPSHCPLSNRFSGEADAPSTGTVLPM